MKKLFNDKNFVLETEVMQKTCITTMRLRCPLSTITSHLSTGSGG